MKFGFRGGNRGGFRKFTPGFRGGRGFNRGGFRGNQSQRSDQFSENGSQFSGFRGGFNNNQCIFLNVFIYFFRSFKIRYKRSRSNEQQPHRLNIKLLNKINS